MLLFCFVNFLQPFFFLSTLRGGQWLESKTFTLFTLPKVETLIWGQTVSGTVERQNAHFYRLNITEQDLKTGVIITCVSNGNGKFKVVFFDTDGNVTMVEESQKRKRHSEANLYVVPYGRYNLVSGFM